MIADEKAIGVIVIYRNVVRPFSDCWRKADTTVVLIHVRFRGKADIDGDCS
jgi:hypothetical protein